MTDLSERKNMGRQPATLYVTPSGEHPWYGTYLGNRALSEQQFNAMISAGLDLTSPETVTVRRNATDREMWWGLNSFPPYFEFECPVLSRLADGRIKVIAPSGANKIVLSDGWATRPGKRKSAGAW